MSIQNFDFPKVTFRQVYSPAIPSSDSTLAVACIGIQYKLHKYGTSNQALIDQSTTAYTPDLGLVIAADDFPGRDTTIDGVKNTLDRDTSAIHLVVVDGAYSYYTYTGTITMGSGTTSPKVLTLEDIVALGGDGTILPAGFGARGARVGDPIILTGTDSESAAVTVNTNIIKISATNNVGYNIITVADVGDLSTITSIKFCEYADVTYEAADGYVTISNEEIITISDSLKTSLADVSSTIDNGTLEFGTFYLEYREILTEYVNQLGVADNMGDVEDILGPVCVDNPLALAVYFAQSTSHGVTTYFTAVLENTPAAYTNAMDFLENYSAVYSIVPCSEDESIVRTCTTMAVNASDSEDSKIRRAVFYGITTDEHPTLWSGTGTVDVDGVVTLSDNVFVEHPFVPGDVLKIGSANYTIVSTNGIDVATLTTAPIVGSNVAISLIRIHPNATNLINNIISKRWTQTERACAVWADGALYNGEEIPGFCLAAAAAGMRAYEPCHRPLSNLTYNLFSVAEPHGFSNAQLKLIGAEGIWIIANNNDGVPINKRQMTTAVANNINLDEESIISNVDTIALSMCRIGESYIGNSNINDRTVDLIQLDIQTSMDNFLLDTTGNPLIGPQILEWNLVSIYQDPVNQDHIYANCTITPPKPFNKFALTMRVI